jgi:hypothetical protein
MDIQIMYFRPKRSPKGPPIKVPAATERETVKLRVLNGKSNLYQVK